HCQKPQSSLGAGGHRRRVGDADLRFRTVADCADLGLRRCTSAAQDRGAAMIIAILNVYLVILFLLVKLKIIRFTVFWKVSPLLVLIALMFGLFIPMGWGAPQGSAIVVRNSVPIVPNVAGEV